MFKKFEQFNFKPSNDEIKKRRNLESKEFDLTEKMILEETGFRIIDHPFREGRFKIGYGYTDSPYYTQYAESNATGGYNIYIFKYVPEDQYYFIDYLYLITKNGSNKDRGEQTASKKGNNTVEYYINRKKQAFQKIFNEIYFKLDEFGVFNDKNINTTNDDDPWGEDS